MLRPYRLKKVFFTSLFALLPFTLYAQEQTFDPAEWTKICDPLPNNAEQTICILSRDVRDPRGQLIGQAALGFPKGGQPNKLTVLVPLPIAVAPGVAIQFDQNQPIVGKVSVCTLQGCFAEIPAGENNFVDMMKKGNVLLVHFKSPPPKVQQLTYGVSLIGFTASFEGEGFTSAGLKAQKEELGNKVSELAEQRRKELQERLQKQSEEAQAQPTAQ